MGKEMMYRDYAFLYDLIYHWKDYKKESEKIKSVIKKYKKSKGKELLEVACGTGNFLEHFKEYNCAGADLNKEILQIAKKKLPKAKFKLANMINSNLGKKYDIIMCLFSSIGYVKTKNNLKKTIFNLSKHLKEGGVIIIEPWPERTISGRPSMQTYKDKDIVISRINVTKVKGNISTLNFVWTVGKRDKEVFSFKDKHELGSFDKNTFVKYFKEAGINAKFHNKGLTGRGLYIGTKQ